MATAEGHSRRPQPKAKATAAGGTHSYNPVRPWDWVFHEAAQDGRFWRRELEDKALLVIAKVSGAHEGVEGDAPTAARAPSKQGHHIATPPPPPVHPLHQASKKQKTGERIHVVGEDGLLTHNRWGAKLCSAFQRGECAGGKGHNQDCPRDRAVRHQCARCLQPGHGAVGCTAPQAREPPRKGQGKKGNGKGSKGKWGRPY